MKKGILIMLFINFLFVSIVLASQNKSPIIEQINRDIVREDKLENSVQLYTDNGTINIYAKGGWSFFSDDLIMPKEIIISETNSGALKKGDKFYLSVKGLKFEDYIGQKTAEGNIDFDCTVIEDGTMEISILGESTQPSSIHIFHMAVNVGEVKKTLTRVPPWEGDDIVTFSYPLMLLTNSDLENNVFSSLEQDIVLNEKFTVLHDYPIEPYRSRYSCCRILAGEDFITFNSNTYPLSAPCYLKEGYFMVPLRETALCLTPYAEIAWDENTQSSCLSFSSPSVPDTEIIVAANAEKAHVFGKEIILSTPAEIKNGVMYMGFRDYINLSGEYAYSNFYWDKENFIVSFIG